MLLKLYNESNRPQLTPLGGSSTVNEMPPDAGIVVVAVTEVSRDRGRGTGGDRQGAVAAKLALELAFIKDRTTEQTYPNGTRTAQIRAHTAPSNR